MKYIEVLNKNVNCADCFIGNSFSDISSISPEEEYFTYRWHPNLSKISNEKLVVVEAFQQPVDFSKNEEFSKVELLIKAHLKAISTSKIPQDTCLLKLVPEYIYEDFCRKKADVLRDFLSSHEKPENYNHFLNIKKVVKSVSRKDVVLDLKKVKSSKQLKIVKSRKHKVLYDAMGTATGRLTTTKDSFPIMTLSAKDRDFISPTNDMLVEFDFNAAEIRTLLALSGSPQPLEDIHEWNLALPGQNLKNRSEAKERFFAWLYNPTKLERSFEKYYNKKIYNKYFDLDRGIVKTPFGRKLKVSEQKALNYLIQSTSSDMMMEQAYKIVSKFEKLNCKSFVKFLMHDSIVIDLHKDDAHLMSSLLEKFSNTRFGKFMVNVRYGKDFYNLRKLKWKM